MKTYHEMMAEKAYNALAAGFVTRTRAAYRNCATEADLRSLSRKCWKERDEAWRIINRFGYDNMTRHGTMPYDKYSALAMEAEAFAKQLYKKAERIKAGEAVGKVIAHVNDVSATTAGFGAQP